MLKNLKNIIPISILVSGLMISTSFADTVLLRVGSGHPSKPTSYVTMMEKVWMLGYINGKRSFCSNRNRQNGFARVATAVDKDFRGICK